MRDFPLPDHRKVLKISILAKRLKKWSQSEDELLRLWGDPSAVVGMGLTVCIISAQVAADFVNLVRDWLRGATGFTIGGTAGKPALTKTI